MRQTHRKKIVSVMLKMIESGLNQICQSSMTVLSMKLTLVGEKGYAIGLTG